MNSGTALDIQGPGAAAQDATWSHGEPVMRPVGLETEFGILQPGNPYANAVAMASEIVAAYGEHSRPNGPAVRWDYEGEDPLADLRGGHLERAAAHPSMLTDDPQVLAPSGDGAGSDDMPPAPWGTRPRPSAAQAALPRATTVVATNGARLYVDHAHPEYSSPEVLTPLDALIWDRAGEVIARQAMTAHNAVFASAGQETAEIVLYKNNVDGKGAAYGSHENYLIRRDLPFEKLAAGFIPFLVTRPVFAGAGRVGIGQRSQQAGFQISQRADYVENDIGLQTTFNRPIINTRDEPHADASRWRRFHVINGDANLFDTPIYLKVATVNLVAWYLERAHDRGLGVGELASFALTGDPVEHHWAFSHDPSLSYTLTTASGPLTALQIQRGYWQAIRRALDDDGITAPDTDGATAPMTVQAMTIWDEVLTALEHYAASYGNPKVGQAIAAAARDVEWLAKYQLCEAMKARSGIGWEDPRLAALDIQWSDLREGKGIAARLRAAGKTRQLVTDAAHTQAAHTPPPGTRAAVRGAAIARHPQVVGASWTSLVIDNPAREALIRYTLPQDVACSPHDVRALLDTIAGACGHTTASGGEGTA